MKELSFSSRNIILSKSILNPAQISEQAIDCRLRVEPLKKKPAKKKAAGRKKKGGVIVSRLAVLILQLLFAIGIIAIVCGGVTANVARNALDPATQEWEKAGGFAMLFGAALSVGSAVCGYCADKLWNRKK